MQSLPSRILTKILCLFFHSRYEKTENLSTTAGQKSHYAKSHYKPLKHRIIKSECNGFYIEKTVPDKVKTDKVIFHIHGGSFKMVLTDFYRKQSVFYSNLFGKAVVYTPDYRVFPDVRYPVPLNDVFEAYKNMLSDGVDADKVIIIGDSCGSNMAASLCMKIRENSLPMPAGLVLFSFWGDLTNYGESYKMNCYRDPFYGIPKRLTYEECKDRIHRVTLYARGENLTDPYLSPCFGDFSAFPKTILVTGSADISQSDSHIAYKKLRDSNVDAMLLDFDNMFHDFQFVKFLPESKMVFKIIKEYM